MAELRTYTKEQLLDFKASLEKEYAEYKLSQMTVKSSKNKKKRKK